MTPRVGLRTCAHGVIHALTHLLPHRDRTRIEGEALESHQDWVSLTRRKKEQEQGSTG